MNDYQFHNKKAIALNMSEGNAVFQGLLNGLAAEEIIILRKHPDLRDSVREITKMTTVQLQAELQGEYNLEIDQYSSQDVWISTEKLDDAIPDWFETCHCGWWVPSQGEGFMQWARDFLMQEVRINIWIRDMEDKKNPKPMPYHGLYL